jgi:ribosomal protein L13E
MSSVGSSEPDVDKHESELERTSSSYKKKSLVFTRRKGVLGNRRGRGYSTKEIVGALANIGLGNQSIAEVRAFHIPVDILRRSTHPENVNELTTILKKYVHSKKTKNSSKKQSQTKDKAANTKTSK